MHDEVLEEVGKPLYRNLSRVMIDCGVTLTLTFQNETCSITKSFTTKNKKTRVVILGYNKKNDTYSIALEAFSHELTTDETGELLFHVARAVVDENHIHAKK